MQQQTEPMPQRIIPIGLIDINIVADKPASAPPMLIKYPCGNSLSSEYIFNPFLNKRQSKCEKNCDGDADGVM